MPDLMFVAFVYFFISACRDVAENHRATAVLGFVVSIFLIFIWALTALSKLGSF